MRDQEILGLMEAYSSIYTPQQELTEEVQIAAQYFYEMGLNEDGVDILIEELGVEEFAQFVYDIAEEYVLTEARAGGAKIEVKTAKGKEIEGKPTAASLKRLRAKKAERKAGEEEASAAKPSGMKASLQRQSAVAAAAKKQPKKPGLLDRVAGAVNRGIERHNKAMGELDKMKAATAVTVGKVKKAAGEFKKGLTSEEVETDFFDYLFEYLIAEGYADTNKAALAIMANMSEEWKQSIIEETTTERLARRADEKAQEPGAKSDYKPQGPGFKNPRSRASIMNQIAGRAKTRAQHGVDSQYGEGTAKHSEQPKRGGRAGRGSKTDRPGTANFPNPNRKPRG